MSSHLKVFDDFQYLGHLISSKSGGNDDILHKIRLLFARTNVLLRKFNKCNTYVKLFLFKAYCMSLYGMAIHGILIMSPLCRGLRLRMSRVNMFFGYARLDSVTSMFFYASS